MIPKIPQKNARLTLLRNATQLQGKPLRHALPKTTLVSKALHKIERTWSEVEPIDPKRFSFDEIHSRLSQIIYGGGSISDFSFKDRRLLPWILFYPAADPQRWLGSNPRVAAQYLYWLAESKNTSALLTLIKVFLLQYPKELPDFSTWLSQINQRLQENTSSRLGIWKERINRFKLLSADGPRLFGAAMQKDTTHLMTVCANAGFVDEMERANFLKESVREVLEGIPTVIRRKDSSLQNLLSFLQFPDGSKIQLRFESLRKKIADSFLLPFKNENPDKDTQTNLQEFFLRCYGDPRITRALWQVADKHALEVILRWLTHATLKDFFAIIATTADERVWGYREDFWSAYLNRGYISDAWVALGSIANITASKSFRDHRGGYATLKGGASNHSVLILRIGNLIIVEWSHSGTCRIWNLNNTGGPKLYKTEYSRYELVTGADFEKRHTGSESGRWQYHISDYIRRQTGIIVKRAEYLS